ncbi:MAG TPA: lysoplasmalogenase [Chitinophagaceae bacterium]|nr:lysoplasmalogenase [Chitinophagaceae bacterium]
MAKKISTLLISLFAIILILDCIFILNGIEEYRIYSKPLLMPVLYILLTVETTEAKHKRSKLYISLAILFSFLGDFALLSDDNKFYFVVGLGCFFTAHIWYSLFFLRIKPLSIKRITSIVLISLVIIIYMSLLLGYLWTSIQQGNFMLPILAYCLILSIMLLSALNTGTGRRIHKIAYQNFIPGAILFVISDSALAVRKFGPVIDITDAAIYSIFVMTTYGFAQVLLIYGAIRIIKK